MTTVKDLYIHLGSSVYAKPGQIHLLASPSDYKELEVFFSSHFNTVSYIYDDIGFPDRAYMCKKGTMFIRDEKGKLVRNEK